MGALSRKLSFGGRILAKTVFVGRILAKTISYGRILAKPVFFGRQKCEISLTCPADLRNFAKMAGEFAKFHTFAGHFSEISHFCRPKKTVFAKLRP